MVRRSGWFLLVLCVLPILALAQGRAIVKGEACGGDLTATFPNCTITTVAGPTTFNDTVTATSFQASATANPAYTFDDSDTASESTDAQLAAQATDTGAGTEDVDVTIATQVNSTLTTRLTIDADGNTTINNSSLVIDNNLTVGDGASASQTITGDVSGTDTVITFGNGVVNVSTGALQEGGNDVYTDADTITKTIYWPAGAIVSDGTNCANPATATINSGPKQYTVICTDNDGSRMHGHVKMQSDWNAGTVTFTVEYIQTAADTSALNMDVACQARGATETVNSTYGTEVAIDDAALTGSNAVDQTTSAAVTCNCTTSCQADDSLWWYLDIDATGTTTAVATLHIIGVTMTYTGVLSE